MGTGASVLLGQHGDARDDSRTADSANRRDSGITQKPLTNSDSGFSIPLSATAAITDEQRSAILREFQEKYGIQGSLSVKHNVQNSDKSKKIKTYDLVVKVGSDVIYRGQLFVKQGKEVFTSQRLADALNAHAQTDDFRNFLSNQSPTLTLFDLNEPESAPESAPETAAAQPALTPAQEQKIQRNEAENKAFESRVSDLFQGKLSVAEVLKIGTTPYCLRIVGADAIPLVVTQSTMRNSASTDSHVKHHTEGHGIPQDTLSHIPEALRNPVFIMKGNREGSLLVISDMTDNKGDNLLFAITLDVRGQHGLINRIDSIYGKKNMLNFLQRAIEADSILAMNMKKADELSSYIGCQSPKSATILCFDDSITYSDENVKPYGEILASKQNTQTEPEEMFSENQLVKYVITPQDDNINVQFWQKPNNSSDFVYSGNGQFCETMEEAREYAQGKLNAYNAAHLSQPESSIHFGQLGNGITCYDVSVTDPDTHDHPVVAHISEEGVLTWNNPDYPLSDADEELIQDMADRQADRFRQQWEGKSIAERYSEILAASKLYQMTQIADDPLTMEEKVAKYEQSVIFGKGDFPAAEPKYQIYQLRDGEQYHGIRFQSLVENKDANLRITDYNRVYTGNWNQIEGKTVRDKLEQIYMFFNSDQRPKGFEGRSLSMSDVVTVTENGQDAAYYVDRFGFADYSDFWKPKIAPEPIEIQGHNLTVDFQKTPFMMMQYRTEEYLGGIDADGHERRDNFGTEDRMLLISTQNDGTVMLDTPDVQNWNLSPYTENDRERIAEEIKGFLDRADASSLRILGGTSSTEMVDIPMTAAENVPETGTASAKEEQTEWRYYIIEDMSTWSTNSGERSLIEMYSLDDAIERFKELRDEAYNAETVYGQDQDKPLARLTLGAEHSSRTAAFDILHVRGGQNYLCTDYRRSELAMHDEKFRDALPKISNQLGFERVIDYTRNEDGSYSNGIDMTFSEWTAKIRQEQQEEKLRSHFNEMDLPRIMIKGILGSRTDSRFANGTECSRTAREGTGSGTAVTV